MRRRALGVAGLALVLAYAASPYITLYRLDRALRSGNADYVNAHVDWPALREGLVAQIDSAVTGQPEQAAEQPRDYAELPAFGSGFVHNMATRMVDKAMDRDTMMSRIHDYAIGGAAATPPDAGKADRALQWACFDSPTSFHVELRIGDDAAARPVRLEMQLMDGQWQVTRADIPPALMMQTASRT